jgi:hypothetical protein
VFNIRMNGIESLKQMLFVFPRREVVKLLLLHLLEKVDLTLHCPVVNDLFLESVSLCSLPACCTQKILNKYLV